MLTSTSLEGKPVEIHVGRGTNSSIFYVHQTVLCSRSPFFKSALASNSDWKERQEHRILLPDDDPTAFHLYIHWLYFHTLPIIHGSADEDNEPEYLDLAKAYILGDKLLDYSFTDIIIDTTLEKSRFEIHDGNYWFPGDRVVEYVYRHTVEGSPIRRLLVDFYAYHGTPEWGTARTFPKPFLFELTQAFLNLNSSCPYHARPLKAHDYYRGAEDENPPARKKVKVKHEVEDD